MPRESRRKAPLRAFIRSEKEESVTKRFSYRLLVALQEKNTPHINRLTRYQRRFSDVPFAHGYHSLHYACEQGRGRVVRWLLEAGVEVDRPTDNMQETALMFAADAGHAGIVRDLLGRGARVNAKDSEGQTALMHAVTHNRIDAVRALLESEELDLNLRDEEHDTALSIACTHGHEEIVSLLLAMGADPDWGDPVYCTISSAQLTMEGNPQAERILDALLRAGASARRTWGSPHLHVAAGCGTPRMLQMLLARGARPNDPHDPDSKAPEYAMDIACAYPLRPSVKEIVDILWDAGAAPPPSLAEGGLEARKSRAALEAAGLGYVCPGPRAREVLPLLRQARRSINTNRALFPLRSALALPEDLKEGILPKRKEKPQ